MLFIEYFVITSIRLEYHTLSVIKLVKRGSQVKWVTTVL